MDVFQTTVTVIQEIYTITVFIRGIVDDVKSYESDRKDIQQKMQHEFLFLDVFKSTFFDDEMSLLRYREQPKPLQADVYNILARLRSILGEYGIEAAKHGLLDYIGAQSVGEDAPSKKELREQVKRICKNALTSAKDLKKKAFDWSLFDKARILKTLAVYSEWTQRLRQTMSLMLTTMMFAEPGRASWKNFAETQEAESMGLQHVAKRQLLARSEPPDDFRALDGIIVEKPDWANTPTLKFAEHHDPWDTELKDYLVEYREYDRALKHAIDAENEKAIEHLKAPARKLAWLLHNASFPDFNYEKSADTSDVPILLSLKCAGYVDQPEQHRTVFLYELPVSGSAAEGHSPIMTLHDLINGNNFNTQSAWRKPSLGNRFFLAYALTMTVLNIHASGWVHKNIWSHGVIVFHANTPNGFSKSHSLIPYLASWGLARPSLGETELAPSLEIEPNLYRHPVRQQQPTSPFSAKHDYYALGVVLIEIGLWKTMGALFKEQIAKGMREDRHLPIDLLKKRWTRTLREEVEVRMGEAYAKAIHRCLTGDFGVEGESNMESDVSIMFRDLVAEVLRQGTKL